MCPPNFIIGVVFPLICELRYEGAGRTQDRRQNWGASSWRGDEVCGWLIHTSDSVGFDCLGLVRIGDKRMYLGIFSYILYEFKAVVFDSAVITGDISDQNFFNWFLDENLT
jgi:hypothetical protein